MPKLVPEFYCTDITKSLAFYVDVLGFTVKFDRPEEGFAYLERQGAEMMLDEINGKSTKWIEKSMEYPFGRGVNLQIETTDVDGLYESVCQTDHTIYVEMEEKWYRCGDEYHGNRQFIVCDPDGYLLRFFEDLGSRDHD